MDGDLIVEYKKVKKVSKRSWWLKLRNRNTSKTGTRVRCRNTSRIGTRVRCRNTTRIGTRVRCRNTSMTGTRVRCRNTSRTGTRVRCRNTTRIGTRVRCRNTSRTGTRVSQSLRCSTKNLDIYNVGTNEATDLLMTESRDQFLMYIKTSECNDVLRNQIGGIEE